MGRRGEQKMFDVEQEYMVRHPIRAICAIGMGGIIGLTLAYMVQTYGFPWLGGFKW